MTEPRAETPAFIPLGSPERSTDAEAILGRQDQRESSARTYARSFPIVPVKAAGMTVVGADGRQYLDCLSGAGTLALGHNHPVVTEAMTEVLESGAPLHVLDVATPIKDHFCNVLFSLLPSKFADRARVQFCGPAGTDAVEAALKLVQTATGRVNTVAFSGAYHGMTSGALSLMGDLHARVPIAAPATPVSRFPFPYDYRCAFGIGGDDGARVGAHLVESMLDDPNGGVLPPAGMILEVVQGEGGVISAPDHWVRSMRRITSERGIPLIVDEVQTGLGRTGALWGVDHAAVTPDVMVLSKAIGGGQPLAVVVYDEDLDVWEPGAHAGTFRGNQLAMAAGAATMQFVAENDLAARAERLGGWMMTMLRSLQDDHPCIGDVRGRGLMIGVELVDHRDAHIPPAPASQLAKRVRAACLERGLIVELGGRHGAVLRLLPPLTMTDEEARSVFERLAEAIAAAEREQGTPAPSAGKADDMEQVV